MQIFDIHAHVYPDAIADRVVSALSGAYDGFPVRNDGRLSTYLAQMDAASITSAALHSVATKPGQAESINRFIMDCAAANPGRIVPFATLHPDMPDLGGAVEEIVRAGFAGVKLHPEMQGFLADERRALDLFSALAGKLPVLLHCGDYRSDHSAPERVKNMLRQVRGLKLVCAHFGGWTDWEGAASILAGEDLWVDCSSSFYALDPAASVSIIRAYGADRVLFGSDFPVFNPGEEVQRLLALPLTNDEKEKILWTNHLSLLEK